MFFRAAINALVTQEWGERMCFNAWLANGLAKGDTWGALLPTYDGMDIQDRRPRDESRGLWPSSIDRVRNQMALETFPPRASVRSMFLPAIWQEPVNYDMEPPVIAPTEGGLLRAVNPAVFGPSALNPPM
jgi:hypothetical protein